MNRLPALFALLLAISTLPTAAADSPVLRDLRQLKTDHDKAIAAAVDPINRRYQAALDQLLRRATQLKDADAAGQIKQEIDAAAPAPVSTVATKLTANMLSRRIVGTVWTPEQDFWLQRIEFLVNNKVRVTFKSGATYPYDFKVTGDDETAFTIDANPTTTIKFAQDLATAKTGAVTLKKQ